MNVKTLNELSLLKKALSVGYSNYLKFAAESSVTPTFIQPVLNLYAAYCYLVKQGSYSALEILNDSSSINAHFQSLIGFVYSRDDITIRHRYLLGNQLRVLFRYIAQDKNLTLNEVKLSNVKITEDASSCLAQFRTLNIDKTKADYLDGWQVVSKEGKEHEVYLDMLYVSFGEAFTNKVHLALKNYAFTQKSSSLTHVLINLRKLFVGFSTIYNERDGLSIEAFLSRNHVQLFFHKVFKVLFVRSQAALKCPKNFHAKWRSTIYYYTECFINTGVFAEPHKPFIVPDWKDPKDAAPTFSIGGNATQTENLRWFANIPLKIKDEEAVSIIKQRIDRDMAHIKHVCLLKFEELLGREARNKVFQSKGLVKPLSGTLGYTQYKNFVGADKLDNTVATFYAHGIAGKDTSYLSFLGFSGNSNQLNTELNLPTKSTLNVLLTLLVIEHPLITPSWLAKWDLFDVNGCMVGYKQVGNKHIAVSYKSRKGSTNAQQEVVLNEFSKSIVEFLIQHTRMSREYLKQKGNVNWRKMILTATAINVIRPSCLNTTLSSANDFYDWLQDKTLFDKSSDITLKDAKAISDIHSLRSVRRHRGFQIYLETRSMDAVAEALGHETKDVKLLTSYLPKSLMDFFNARWIRQFQNAILLEAMKDSVYRLDAVNMSAEDIEEFLNNHGISNIPEHFDHGFTQQTTDNQVSESLGFDQLTYTISTSLLQLLMAIRFVVESSDDGEIFLDIVAHWYQSAVFVLDTLSSSKHSADDDLMGMLDLASNNKLDTESIKGALLC
ncbi:hypothetical protein VSVS12_00234 [Vibrio scophthalmi]|uniref:hypothetical protein n=1 Tax=Vibrio scophthalmi TaxID=45658 RepID=UPI0008096DF4|nr:hypothetical protein [Vibrio scophthalmi]ANS84058.1 hypothetical protein VSVS12_00234 [Vibrio scophthalmi]